MAELVATKKARSPHQASKLERVVSRAQGTGSLESRAKRLVRNYYKAGYTADGGTGEQ
jgi:hypothetical protein